MANSGDKNETTENSTDVVVSTTGSNVNSLRELSWETAAFEAQIRERLQWLRKFNFFCSFDYFNKLKQAFRIIVISRQH